MEIAKMLNISERSVTRLINKSKEFKIHQYGSDVVDEVFTSIDLLTQIN